MPATVPEVTASSGRVEPDASSGDTLLHNEAVECAHLGVPPRPVPIAPSGQGESDIAGETGFVSGAMIAVRTSVVPALRTSCGYLAPSAYASL